MRQTALKVPGKARRGVKVFDASESFGQFFLGYGYVWMELRNFCVNFSFWQLPIQTELGTRMGLIYLDMDCINLRFRDRLLLWYWQ